MVRCRWDRVVLWETVLPKGCRSPIHAGCPDASQLLLLAGGKFGFHDKGKLLVRTGRKAMGPRERIARLPKEVDQPTPEACCFWSSGQREERFLGSAAAGHDFGGGALPPEAEQEETPPAARCLVHTSLPNAGTMRNCHMLSRLSKAVVHFLRREDGPTAVEYAVMLALIIVVCIAAITTVGKNANATFNTVGSQLGGTAGS
jgi:pilus assembly protein Flp/PilA